MRPLTTCAVLIAAGITAACHRPPPPTDVASDSRSAPTVAPKPAIDLAYVCPMDRDIRSSGPGTCPRCGMTLVAGIPDQTEYHVDVAVSPRPARPRELVHVTFAVSDPWKDRPVEKFTIVHEKLFHAFFVSRDLQFFVHDHPVWRDGAFHYDIAFPRPGMYRVLGDFYPEGASPQLASGTIFVAGDEPAAAPLARDYSTKDSENLKIQFATSPERPVAGVTAQMRVTLSPGDGLQKYLGAWGHMLAASDDLIDMIHTHPYIADGNPEMQFTLVFPRPRTYRVWVQFQRSGIVNTAHFDVPVGAAHRETAGAN
jgi:Heavy metal binding domain